MAKNYDLRTRHIIVNGKNTTMRLENLCWAIVERLATEQRTKADVLINAMLNKKPADFASGAAWVRICLISILVKNIGPKAG